MEYQFERKHSRDPQSSGRTEKVISTSEIHSLKLQDRFRSERPSLSYADFHHEIIKGADELPSKFSGNQQKLQVGRKAAEDDELVKYMSNLPSYLARGENLKEKALNVGVLDWGRLEKWQHSLKQAPCRSSGYSPSCSNDSSVFSTDGTSTNSSSVNSCSPSRQRMRRPSLQSHLKASPQECCSQGVVKSFGGNAGKFQDLKVAKTETLKGKEKISETDKPFCKNQSESKLDHNIKKDSNSKCTADLRRSSYLENYVVASCSNGKMEAQNDEFTEKAEKSEKSNTDIVDRDCAESQNTVVLLLPREIPETSCSGVSQISGSKTITGRRSTEASRSNSTERSFPKEVHCGKFYSNIPHSCPLPYEVENSKQGEIRRRSSMDAQSNKSLSNEIIPLPRSSRIFTSPSRSRKIEEKATRLPTDSTVIKPSQVSDQKTRAGTAAKVRNSSPTRLFSFGMSKISRSFNSKEDPDVQNSSSTHVTAKPGKERLVTSACLDNSSNDKQNATDKPRTSPLRRLLDPILKPRAAAGCRRSSEAIRKGSTSIDKASKSSDGQLESSALHSVKAKLDLTNCKSISVNDSLQTGKVGSQAVQALLQVAIKNGIPLFTFAVDNNSGILAATMKKLNASVKDCYSCLYTFFAIREIKKKSWINQGSKSKGKGHDYIPNVIAQMKASDYQFSNSTRQNLTDHFRMREFILFAVDPRQADQQTSDFLQNDELAAIVVKIPKENTNLIQDDSKSEKKLQNQTFVGSQNHRSTTVILPSGVHSLPSKGEASSLVERWISGGACDCGGWDLGCKLRVLGDGIQLNKKMSSSKSCSTSDQFELFQEDVQENQPAFSLAPFKDGIYSVEFKPSLTHLQAFSICIAALNSGKLSMLSDLAASLEEKTSEEAISMENDGMKVPNGIQTEVLARYVSYPPPLSPAGRV